VSDLPQSERWEYYRESIPTVGGITVSFDTVRIVGGRNLFRCHDAERAKLAAAAPLLLAALEAQEEAERARTEWQCAVVAGSDFARVESLSVARIAAADRALELLSAALAATNPANES
jgi:hypothetical protein